MSDYGEPLMPNEAPKKKIDKKRIFWTATTMVMTFLIYASYHMTRKIPSVVINVIHPLDSSKGSNFGIPQTVDGQTCNNTGWAPFNLDTDPGHVNSADVGLVVTNTSKSTNVNGHYFADSEKAFATYAQKKTNFADEFSTSPLIQYCSFNTSELEDYCGAKDVTTSTVDVWVITDGLSAVCNLSHTFFVAVSTSPVPNDAGGSWANCSLASDATPKFEVYQTANGYELQGYMITLYLSFYALGLFITGHIADQMNLKLFVCLGMMGSALTVALIGLGYYFGIDTAPYYFIIYAIQGLCQATGWPAVVAITGPWLGKGKRGFLMGIWNAHTSVGNIMGNVIGAAGLVIKTPGFDCNNNWPMAFILAACVMTGINLITVLVLRSHPSKVGLDALGEEDAKKSKSTDSDMEEFAGDSDEPKKKKKPTFLRALAVPGLIEFALCLFFCKLVAYTFIYWGPTYVGTIGGISAVNATADSSFLDWGGIIGGVGAGLLADVIKSQAIVAFGCLICGIVALYVFRTLTATLTESSIVEYKLLMMMVGMFINAPYALITTAVSADLGTTTKGDEALMATVTGIIDGTGSIGAAVQGALISYISLTYGWNSVFYLLMIFLGVSAITLGRLVYRDICRLCCKKGQPVDGE